MTNSLFRYFGSGSVHKGKDPCTLDSTKNCNKTDKPEKFLSDTAQTIINVLLIAAGIVAVVAIIYGGVSMMTAAGDPGKITKGKKAVFGGVIGLLIVLLAGAIVNFVLANL